MRIKFNDKIYRLKEIESGVDSLMELVEEPKFKDGDFLHSDWGDENITIICRKINGNDIYYHVSKSNCLGLNFDKDRFWSNRVDFRLATEEEKQKMLDALAERGKRWNAEKLCVEDIPAELKKGDLAIFWDHDKEFAIIKRYYRLNKGVEYRRHQDIQGLYWDNAIKFESKEQFEKLINGEI